MEVLYNPKEKIELYNYFITFMLDSMSMKGTQPPKKMRAMGTKLQSLGLRMVLISSDKVVEKFLEWRGLSVIGEDPEGVFRTFAELLIEMRKEILVDTNRTANDVLDILTS